MKNCKHEFVVNGTYIKSIEYDELIFIEIYSACNKCGIGNDIKIQMGNNEDNYKISHDMAKEIGLRKNTKEAKLIMSEHLKDKKFSHNKLGFPFN